MRLRYKLAAAFSASAVAVAIGVSTSGGSAATSRRAAAAVARHAAVGALFSLTSNGKLANHFCTGTVVDSPSGNVVLTAAHCLSNQTVGSFAFVPGYKNGKAPLGVWVVKKFLVDRAWSSSTDPDHDFAFLVVSQRGTKSSLEALTGADRLGTTGYPGKLATVVGYPSTSEKPIACKNALRSLTGTQLEFDCDGYTNGTSGSALVVDPDPATGLGTVVGVIGGFQQGGTTASVSYAAAFGGTTEALYEQALGAN